MSLLNKMLADLEARAADVQTPQQVGPVLAGLAPVRTSAVRKTNPRLVMITVFLVVSIGVAAVRFWPADLSVPLLDASHDRLQRPPATATTTTHADAVPLEEHNAPRAGGRSEESQRGHTVVTAAVEKSLSVVFEEKPSIDPPLHDEQLHLTEPSPNVNELPAEPSQVPGTDVAVSLGPHNETGKTRRSSGTVSPHVAAPDGSEMAAAAPERTQTMPRNLTASRPVAPNSEPMSVASTASQRQERSGVIPPKDEPALRKAPKRPDPVTLAEQAYQQGLSYYREGRLAEAEDRLRVALLHDVGHTQARQALANVLLNTHRYTDAQLLLEEGRHLHPRDADLALLLSRVYVEQGLQSTALQLLESVRSDAGANPDYFALLGHLYQSHGQFNQAASAYQRALAHRPQEGRWWVGLGLAQESTEAWQAAYRSYSRALTSGNLPATLIGYTQQRLNHVSSVLR